MSDRDAAEALRGSELQVSESDIPQAPEGVYYHYQIIDSTVVDLSGRRIGSVSGIMETGSNDVYVVSSPEHEEILVPATRSVVKEIDTVNKTITVDLPPAGEDSVEEEEKGSES